MSYSGSRSRSPTRLNGTPHLVDLHPQSQGFIPQIQETVNAAAAARYGLTPGDVRRQAAIIFGSQELGELWYGGIAIGVTGWSIPRARQQPQRRPEPV